LNSQDVTNLFAHHPAARRYALARPYFHPLIARMIATFTSTTRFSLALDVACGTGQSSRALVAIADRVHAIDVSPAMVAEAESHAPVFYGVASAESLPFPDDSFNLITVGLAFHWFDQVKFLREAHRVLKTDAWLVIYNSGFFGEMAENAAFSKWAQKKYPKRFPTPPRHNRNVDEETIGTLGFTLQRTEKFTHDEKMRAEQLTGYLLTQTNVIAAVESGTVPLETAAKWIHNGIKPFFNNKVRTMKFGGSISFLRGLNDANR
jgi:SAM-dependent methyltransferase